MSAAAAASGGGSILVANSGRIDYDGTMDWASLGSGTVATCREDPASDAEFTRRVEECPAVEVVVTKEVPVRASVIESFPDSVKLLCEAGTGYNNVDLEACRRKGITVMNVPAYSSDAVATLVMTFILNFSSSLHLQMRRLSRGDRVNFSSCLQAPHFELRGKTLGLVGGSGGIGSRVRAMARAFGMKVLISTRAPREAEEGGEVQFTDSVPDLLRTSDFVSLHCPLNEATRHLIDAAALRTMKPSAFLVNTARGDICDEAALVDALSEGVIAGAGLDVQSTEPPREDSPLYALDNVILTPHIGWKRKETREALVATVAANIASFYAAAPQNVVS
jgi:glycerate dehydrogenase